MKKRMFWCAMATIALTTSCTTTTKKGYTLTGQVDTTFNGSTVYLKDYNGYADKDGNYRFDSATVVNGTFTFEGRQDTASFCRVYMNRAYADVFLENGDIVVDLENHKAVGSQLNEVNNTFRKDIDEFMRALEIEENFIKNNPDYTTEERNEKFKELWENRRPRYAELYLNGFNANKENAVGAQLLDEMFARSLTEPDSVLNYVEMLMPVYQHMPSVQKLNGRAETLLNTKPGKLFTDFMVVDEQGKEQRLSDFVGKGKYALVDFWASWCGPCRREMPTIAELYKEYGKNGKMEILGVATWDKEEDTRKAMEELNVVWPQIMNSGDVASEAYGINGIPHVILFAPDGTIVARDLRGEEMKEAVKKAMNK